MSDYAWSKSSLKSVLENCSWQWALRKVYKIEDHGSPQTAMGTGYHKALEEWERSGRTMSLSDMQSVAAETAFEECKSLPMEQWFEHGTDPEQVIELAKESVRLWAEARPNKGSTLKEIAESRTLVSVEDYFNYEYNNYRIQGYTDAIYHDDKNIYVVDHKTASSMRRWTYEQKPNVEMAMYMVLAERAKEDNRIPDLPVSFEYHVSAAKEGKTRLITCGYMNKELEQLFINALTEADAIRKNHAFRPKPDWNLCSKKYCAYFEGCRVNGTLSPYALTISNVPTDDTPMSQ